MYFYTHFYLLLQSQSLIHSSTLCFIPSNFPLTSCISSTQFSSVQLRGKKLFEMVCQVSTIHFFENEGEGRIASQPFSHLVLRSCYCTNSTRNVLAKVKYGSQEMLFLKENLQQKVNVLSLLEKVNYVTSNTWTLGLKE